MKNTVLTSKIFFGFLSLTSDELFLKSQTSALFLLYTLFLLIFPHHFLSLTIRKSHLDFLLHFCAIFFYPTVCPRIEQEPVLLSPALFYFLPQRLPCFYDLGYHVTNLYHIIVVLHPLIIMAEPVFQIIPLFFQCMEPFVFYFPSPSSSFHCFFYISTRNAQIRYIQKFLFLFLTLVFYYVDTLSPVINLCHIVIHSFRFFLTVLFMLF